MENWKELLKVDIEAFNEAYSKVENADRIIFRGEDLSAFDMSNVALHRSDLTFTNLGENTISGYILSTCRLKATNLSKVLIEDEFWKDKVGQIQKLWQQAEVWNKLHAQIQPCIFSGVQFSEASFREHNLEDCSFNSSVFDEASFEGVIFDESSFQKSSFVNAHFKGSKAVALSMMGANLEKSVWENMQLEDSKFNDANLQGATFKNCTLSNVIFNDANASAICFEACNFIDVQFFDTQLREASFEGCTFRNTNLDDAVK